ncbi:uncharacterized protein LOC111008987 [Momordica charantia]|uniref:Uncharacterized protein LOC111008987 n=1 Tax=Momordica charantia TaxID=3673 RepID=A0A6J1C707_MOMCH|nr:uncharacterized protein LOC111008987 [Momordica charantia]
MAGFWVCSGPNKKNKKKKKKKNELLRSGEEELSSNSSKSVSENGNRVMVVVDWSIEAQGALQWTLSHALHTHDTILLLHVLKTSNKQGFGFNNKVDYIKAYELLFSMRNMCLKRRPEVQVEIALLEGKERGPVIVEEAKKHKLSLLVLGQRKRPILRRLLNRWATRSDRRGRKKKKTTCRGTVEYCIQNSSCLTIAVRKKSRQIGGYLITTKRHRNFWLLA